MRDFASNHSFAIYCTRTNSCEARTLNGTCIRRNYLALNQSGGAIREGKLACSAVNLAVSCGWNHRPGPISSIFMNILINERSHQKQLAPCKEETDLKLAKVVFTVAGIWGILVTLPLYFLYDLIGHQSPPVITHPEFYYGFAGVTLTWQVVFLLIAKDPSRYRVMIIPSILEKFSYVLANLGLFANQRMSASQALPSTTDLVLAFLFITAFLKTTSAP